MGDTPGECIDIDRCTSGGVAIPGYCPGPFEIKCCVHGDVTCDPDAHVLPSCGLVEAPGAGGCPSGMVAAGTFCVDRFEATPVVVLACLQRYRDPNPYEGASVYPACQNLLLAARALGYGGVMTGWHSFAEDEVRSILGIPDDVFIAATIALGRPEGHHGPVRRRPVGELVFEDRWQGPATWAVDPEGTSFTSAGPPRS